MNEYSPIETRTLPDRDGFQLTARKFRDTDSTPFDAESYTSADIRAWKADRWTYVGIEVTASRNGVELGTASLWAVEDGTMADGTVADAFSHTLSQEGYDLPGDAIDDAIVTLRNLSATPPPDIPVGVEVTVPVVKFTINVPDRLEYHIRDDGWKVWVYQWSESGTDTLIGVHSFGPDSDRRPDYQSAVSAAIGVLREKGKVQ